MIISEGTSIFKAVVFSGKKKKILFRNLFLDLKSNFVESILRNPKLQ